MAKKDPKRQEWATPSAFIKEVEAKYGALTMDVCATKLNTKCGTFITPEMDSLSPHQPWVFTKRDVAWCNPGFANVRPWFEKAHAESLRIPGSKVIVLAPVNPSTGWFVESALMAREIRLLAPRLQFDPAEGIKKSSNEREHFIAVFCTRLLHSGYNRDRLSVWVWKTTRILTTHSVVAAEKAARRIPIGKR